MTKQSYWCKDVLGYGVDIADSFAVTQEQFRKLQQNAVRMDFFDVKEIIKELCCQKTNIEE